jgi:hypothetical protein
MDDFMLEPDLESPLLRVLLFDAEIVLGIIYLSQEARFD